MAFGRELGEVGRDLPGAQAVRMHRGGMVLLAREIPQWETSVFSQLVVRTLAREPTEQGEIGA